jgi:hypothetical protein
VPSRQSLVSTLTLAAVATFMSCKTSGTPASSTIGTAGGTVTSSDGLATLTVSAGALSADTVITIAAASGVPSGAIGTAYEISPTGTAFLKPAGLVIALGTTAGAGRLAIGTVTSGQWTPLAMSSASSDGKSVTALLTHLSPYGVIPLPSCSSQTDCQTPFQCVENECAIPCRDAADCPPPMGCNASVCGMSTCSVDADCAGTAEVPSATGAFSAGCDLFTHLCIDFDSLQNRMPGQPCMFDPIPGLMPPIGFCPGAQDELCGSCEIKNCTYPAGDPGGTQLPNCSTLGEACAYGSCWPTSEIGCMCGSAGCLPCTSSTGGAGAGGSTGGTSGSGGQSGAGGQAGGGGGGVSGFSSGGAGASGTSGAAGAGTGGSSGAGGASGGGAGGTSGGSGGAGGITCPLSACSSNADCSSCLSGGGCVAMPDIAGCGSGSFCECAAN